MTLPPPDPVTAAKLWNRRWYLVVDDEAGGWAIATVDRPVSELPAGRDRVLFEVVWEEHGRRLVNQHNRELHQLHQLHVCDERGSTGEPGLCHLLPPHGGRCEVEGCGHDATGCAHQPPWETHLLCAYHDCAVH